MRRLRNILAFAACGVFISFSIVLVPIMGLADDCPGAAIEAWDSGVANGWIGTVGTTASVMNSGGNPDGYLKGEREGPVMIQSDTPPFSGDYATGGIGKISIDIQLFSGNDVSGPLIRVRQDAFSNGWFYDFAGTLTIDGLWHTYVAPVSSNWSDQQAQDAGWQPMDNPIQVSFADTLAGVGYLIFWVNATNTAEVAGFDNATLSCSLFVDGFESGNTLGWDAVSQ